MQLFKNLSSENIYDIFLSDVSDDGHRGYVKQKKWNNFLDLTFQANCIKNHGMKTTSNLLIAASLTSSKEDCLHVFEELKTLKAYFSVHFDGVNNMENRRKLKNVCHEVII